MFTGFALAEVGGYENKVGFNLACNEIKGAIQPNAPFPKFSSKKQVRYEEKNRTEIAILPL